MSELNTQVINIFVHIREGRQSNGSQCNSKVMQTRHSPKLAVFKCDFIIYVKGGGNHSNLIHYMSNSVDFSSSPADQQQETFVHVCRQITCRG